MPTFSSDAAQVVESVLSFESFWTLWTLWSLPVLQALVLRRDMFYFCVFVGFGVAGVSVFLSK